jgi:hypothetical protein
MLDLGKGVELGQVSGESVRVRGQTISRQDAIGNRWSWPVRVGDFDFAIWETLWSTGERDLVLAKPETIPELPVEVVNLMGRQRAGVAVGDSFEFITARRVDPGVDGRPRRTECSADDINTLIPKLVRAELDQLGLIAIDTRARLLSEDGRHRNHLIAAFAAEDRRVGVAVYVLTRLMQTFARARLGTVGGL